MRTDCCACRGGSLRASAGARVLHSLARSRLVGHIQGPRSHSGLTLHAGVLGCVLCSVRCILGHLRGGAHACLERVCYVGDTALRTLRSHCK